MIEATSPQPMHLDPVNENREDGSRKILIMAAAVIMIVLLAFTILSARNSKEKKPLSNIQNTPSVPTPSLIPYPTLGSMTIYHETGEKRFPRKEQVKLIVNASSENKNIVGYDIVLSYDKDAFSFVKAESKLSTFSLFSYDRSSHVSLSGIRSLQDTAEVSWVKQPLVEVIFQPKKQGNFVFELSPNGKETSKLVDGNSQVVYPKTNQLQLEIYE